MTLKARVRAGRLVFDEPPDLPDGTEVELLPLDPGDWLDDADRAALHDALRQSDGRSGSWPSRQRRRRPARTSLHLKRRQVLLTATARRHVLRERDWWVTNRENVEAFASDLDRALDLIAPLPGVGSRYPRIPGMRRIFLERAAVHVYFTFDGDRHR